MTLNEILDKLTDDEIIEIVYSLGADRHEITDNAIIFPTICHNEESEDASMKLYYYTENKKFHCYTECDCNFNLFSLIEKVFILRGGNKVDKKEDKKNPNDFYFYDIVLYLSNYVKDQSFFEFNKKDTAYKSQRDKFKRKNRELELPVFSNNILTIFDKVYPSIWLEEGITKGAMDEYNILYSISRNKIIIPHYNINGDLVGVRGRALNEDEVKIFGKYMPIEVEDNWYKHPLSQNLYGLNVTQDAIRRTKQVVIFEGEKSCLLHKGFFGKDCNAVACCGSSINKVQINILLKTCHPDEIIIAFDKEYEKCNSPEGDKYFDKLYKMCEKYNNYANFSFIYDTGNLLELKDSPVDKGIEIYKKLYKGRVIVK
jgi:hypothetical protein